MAEIWTARGKLEEEGKTLVLFDVLDEESGEVRSERRYEEAIPLMMVLGGYPEQIGILLMDQELPWRFQKSGDNIYLDGPSIGVEGYHPIE